MISILTGCLHLVSPEVSLVLNKCIGHALSEEYDIKCTNIISVGQEPREETGAAQLSVSPLKGSSGKRIKSTPCRIGRDPNQQRLCLLPMTNFSAGVTSVATGATKQPSSCQRRIQPSSYQNRTHPSERGLLHPLCFQRKSDRT